jgi:hypothetical protein
MRFFVSQQSELQNVFYVIFMSYLLDVLQMCKDLYQLVPNGVCEVFGLLNVINSQQLFCHI